MCIMGPGRREKGTEETLERGMTDSFRKLTPDTKPKTQEWYSHIQC